MGNETDGIVNELCESFKQAYQEGLEKNGELLYYSLHKARLRRDKSYIESLEWLRNKRATINPHNKKDDKCFQYAATAALNH